MNSKAIKITGIVASMIVGLLAIAGIIVYLNSPVEAERPSDVRPELWEDTQEYYKYLTEESEAIIDGERVEQIDQAWRAKWFVGMLKSGDMLNDYTDNERELIYTMTHYSGFVIDLATKVDDDTLKKYEEAKYKIELLLYVHEPIE